MKFYKLVLLSSAVATLVACGGGGDAPVSEAADKFVGTWGGCAPVTGAVNGVVSARADYVLAKTGANSLSVSLDGTGFSAANCTGTQINKLTGMATGTMVLNGTKVIAGQTVDRIDSTLTSSNPSLNFGKFKDIAVISGNKINFGAASPTDADGYPTLVDTLFPYIKQ
jgi:hypothetical protein